MDKNQEKAKEIISKAWKTTANIGKKTADGIQKGAKAISEQHEKRVQERQRAKEEPITKKIYKSKNFHTPNIIVIIDDAEKRDQPVYKDAIGYRKNHKAKNQNVEVFYLFDEYAKDTELSFIPFCKCDNIYCVDPFDSTRFINVSDIFAKTNEEKLAELEHIAYSLGAKSCSIEIISPREFM